MKDYERPRPFLVEDMKWPEGVTLSKETIKEIVDTLKHARIFITSRQKMHPTGIELYDELIERLLEGNDG